MLAARRRGGSRARPRATTPSTGTSGGRGAAAHRWPFARALLRRGGGRPLGATSTSGSTRATTTGCPTSSRPAARHRPRQRSTWTAWRSRPLPAGPRRLGGPTPPHGGGRRSGRRRARQCPLGGAHPGRRGQRRHARRRLAALARPSTSSSASSPTAWTSCSAPAAASGSATASPTRRPLHSCRRARLPLGCWAVGHHRRRGAHRPRPCDEQMAGGLVGDLRGFSLVTLLRGAGALHRPNRPRRLAPRRRRNVSSSRARCGRRGLVVWWPRAVDVRTRRK